MRRVIGRRPLAASCDGGGGLESGGAGWRRRSSRSGGRLLVGVGSALAGVAGVQGGDRLAGQAARRAPGVDAPRCGECRRGIGDAHERGPGETDGGEVEGIAAGNGRVERIDAVVRMTEDGLLSGESGP